MWWWQKDVTVPLVSKSTQRTKTREGQWGLWAMVRGILQYSLKSQKGTITFPCRKIPSSYPRWWNLLPPHPPSFSWHRVSRDRWILIGSQNIRLQKTVWYFFSFSCLLLGVPWVHNRNLRKAIPQRVITKKNRIALCECPRLYLYIHVLCIKREVPWARNIDSEG
jgi:hypothetical protein